LKSKGIFYHEAKTINAKTVAGRGPQVGMIEVWEETCRGDEKGPEIPLAEKQEKKVGR